MRIALTMFVVLLSGISSSVGFAQSAKICRCRCHIPGHLSPEMTIQTEGGAFITDPAECATYEGETCGASHQGTLDLCRIKKKAPSFNNGTESMSNVQ